MLKVILPRHIRVKGSGVLGKSELNALLKKLTKKQLMALVQGYNNKVALKNYSGLKKAELIDVISKLVNKAELDSSKKTLMLNVSNSYSRKLSLPSKKQASSSEMTSRKMSAWLKRLKQLALKGAFPEFRSEYLKIHKGANMDSVRNAYYKLSGRDLPSLGAEDRGKPRDELPVDYLEI